MNEARYASLSSGLLARKGGAKPAMRPQGFGPIGAAPIGGTGLEDLGWNDMGQVIQGQDELDAPEHVPSSISALTPAPKPLNAEEPPVVEQQRAIAENFGSGEEAPEPQPASLKPADVVALPKRPAPAVKGKKSAFTLRLDPERHFRLRLACALTGRSAQQIVTGALDQCLESIPELDALAEKVPVNGARRKG